MVSLMLHTFGQPFNSLSILATVSEAAANLHYLNQSFCTENFQQTTFLLDTSYYHPDRY